MPIQKTPMLKNSFLTLLKFLQHKTEDKGLAPVISVAKIIDMLKSTGITISYQQLLDLTKDANIASMIKSINRNQLVIRSVGDEEVPQPMPTPEPEEENPEEEFNPEEFESSENEEGTGEEFGGPNEEEYMTSNPRPKKGVISTMARRALKRPD